MPKALIIGAGDGLSASMARLLAREGYAIALAARNTPSSPPSAPRPAPARIPATPPDPAQVAALFEREGDAEMVVYNASYRTRGPIGELDPAEVERSDRRSLAFGAFLVAQQAARRMLPQRAGHHLVDRGIGRGEGLSASRRRSRWANSRCADWRRAMARELHPQGMHVAHVVIDGGIQQRPPAEPPDKRDSLLDPDAIAETYMHLIRQPRSAWSLGD